MKGARERERDEEREPPIDSSGEKTKKKISLLTSTLAATLSAASLATSILGGIPPSLATLELRLLPPPPGPGSTFRETSRNLSRA